MTREPAKGFTLIEVVVTLSIVGFFAGLVGAPLINMMTIKKGINEKIAQDADATFALKKISNEIRFGGDDSPCSGGDTVAIDTTAGSSIGYNLVGDELKLIENGNDSVMLTGVKGFSCNEIGSLDLYELTLELESKTYKSRAYRRDRS